MSDVWTIGRMVGWATNFLSSKGSETPRLDTQLLLGHVCGLDKVHLYVQFDRPLQPDELTEFKALLQRRADAEPVAYILGEKEFYGRPFSVSPAVLVPRPETEHLVDAVLEYVANAAIEAPRIVDVGTGSGCIAITLAKELPKSVVVGIDTSADALAQAAANADTLDVRDQVKLSTGHILSPIKSPESVDVVVSNPPYLDAKLMSTLPRDVADHEPELALTGGPDGLDVVRPLIQSAVSVLKPGGFLALELAGKEQIEQVRGILTDSNAFETASVIDDYQQIPRVITAKKHG